MKNLRLKELERQAEKFVLDIPASLDINEYTAVFNEKLAELIIAECTEQVRGQYLPVMEDEAMMKDTHWDGYVQCGVDSVVAIREYFFGVEE